MQDAKTCCEYDKFERWRIEGIPPAKRYRPAVLNQRSKFAAIRRTPDTANHRRTARERLAAAS
jgi:hypothetical protein